MRWIICWDGMGKLKALPRIRNSDTPAPLIPFMGLSRVINSLLTYLLTSEGFAFVH